MTGAAGPDLAPHRGGFRVWCDEHKLDRQVATRSHATNLLALHLRRDHADDDSAAHDEPAVLELTAAARAMLEARGSGYALREDGAEAVWCALTGLEPTDAWAYAEQLADRTRPTTAVVPPF